MLSKLRWAGHAPAAQAQAVQAGIARHYAAAGRAVQMQPLPEKGTLGLCFLARAGGEEWFIKSHAPGRALAQNLAKETAILRHLYGGALVRECFALPEDGRLCLAMARLAPLAAAPSPQAVARLVAQNQAALAGLSPQDAATVAPAAPPFAEVLAAAENALAALAEAGQLSLPVAADCAGQLRRLVALAGGAHTLCHGDLTNQNLMAAPDAPDTFYCIDWEDAFYGPPGYDYAYWLTGMAQRRHYATPGLLALGGQPLAKPLMVAIVLVKCHISQLSGSWRHNTLGFEERVSEILQLEEAQAP